ncbi:MAG: dicarboxylate/amino acid:cation symporter [Arenicellaceae bacterium]|nr:dicarboxylate/amino acid:cation symporter [Arenicellaceae bacterium]
MHLATRVMIALILGIIVGLGINFGDLNQEGGFINQYLTTGLFYVVGTIFVNALKMLVVPLVLFSLIPGIVGIGDLRMLGRVGGKSFILYIFTTAIAIATAIAFAVGFGIGEGLQIVSDVGFSGREAPPVSQVFIDIVPSNPIAAMAEGDMLAIIFFSILFGISLLAVAKESPLVIDFVEQMNGVMMKMVTIVMHLAPYAVFCLVAKALAELGLDLLLQLLGYSLVLAGVLVFHVLVTQMALLKFIGGLSPIIFLKKLRTAQLFAFSTSSSGATIPITLRTTQERLGVSQSVSAFTVPFGATINMDGTAMMQGVATVFIANIYGLELGMSGYLTVIVMAVLASIGAAAVPAVGLVMLTMVFSQVGLPVEGIGLILGVDRLLDMLRTAVNVTGDAVVTSIVAKGESKIDLDVFNDPEAGVIDD